MAHDYVNSIEDAWQNGGIPLRDDTNIKRLLEVLVTEYKTVTVGTNTEIGYGESYGESYGEGDVPSDLQLVNESNKIRTSQGESLNKLGQLIGLRRRLNEDDATYRARIRGNFRASTTGTTFSDTVQFVASLLDVSIDDIELQGRTEGDTPTIEVFVPGTALDTIDIETATFVDIVNRVVAASHSVSVLSQGSFELRTAADPSEAEHGLIAEGGSGGGKLASPPQ